MAFQKFGTSWLVDFDNKVGEMVCISPELPNCPPETLDIFDSNGLMAVFTIERLFTGVLLKYKHFLIINEDHLCNMLGLTPGHENYFGTVVIKLTLSRRFRNLDRIVYLFRLAIPDLDIEIIDD